MHKILRTLTGLIGVLMLAIGLGFLFAPGQLIAQFALFPTGSAGYSTARGTLASLFLGSGIFALPAAIRLDRRWLAPPIVLIGLAALGRMLSLMLDGRHAAFLGDAATHFAGPITVGKDGMMLSFPPGGTIVTLRELL